jgi:hypothetical protein
MPSYDNHGDLTVQRHHIAAVARRPQRTERGHVARVVVGFDQMGVTVRS